MILATHLSYPFAKTCSRTFRCHIVSLDYFPKDFVECTVLIAEAFLSAASVD